jgi:hypothetical protein
MEKFSFPDSSLREDDSHADATQNACRLCEVTDLGAGRADGEDFLTYDWTEGGSYASCTSGFGLTTQLLV